MVTMPVEVLFLIIATMIAFGYFVGKSKQNITE
jgi:hypothetical protein